MIGSVNSAAVQPEGAVMPEAQRTPAMHALLTSDALSLHALPCPHSTLPARRWPTTKAQARSEILRESLRPSSRHRSPTIDFQCVGTAVERPVPFQSVVGRPSLSRQQPVLKRRSLEAASQREQSLVLFLRMTLVAPVPVIRCRPPIRGDAPDLRLRPYWDLPSSIAHFQRAMLPGCRLHLGKFLCDRASALKCVAMSSRFTTRDTWLNSR